MRTSYWPYVLRFFSRCDRWISLIRSRKDWEADYYFAWSLAFTSPHPQICIHVFISIDRSMAGQLMANGNDSGDMLHACYWWDMRIHGYHIPPMDLTSSHGNRYCLMVTLRSVHGADTHNRLYPPIDRPFQRSVSTKSTEKPAECATNADLFPTPINTIEALQGPSSSKVKSARMLCSIKSVVQSPPYRASINDKSIFSKVD